MKKLINDPLKVVDEMVEGLVLADKRLARVEGENVILRADYASLAASGKVALISGGGAGHEPAHAGYVGAGMLTAAVIGQVFTSPSVDAVLSAIRAVAGAAGVLLIVKNYTGDRLNFGLAAELARASGIAVEMVIVADDVALDGEGAVGRRGIAGTVLVHKVAGAAADAGLSLAEVKKEAQAAIDAVVTMGLGLGSCIVPAAGKPGFELGETEVEYGLGIHGERGTERLPIATADAMLDRLFDRLVERSGLRPSDRVALLVNNLGGTAVQELAIVTRHALARLGQAKVEVVAAQAGTFLSALEMPGCSISLMKVDDARFARLLAPCSAAAWTPPTSPAIGAPSIVRVPEDAHAALATGPAWTDAAQSQRFIDAILAVAAALQASEQELTRLDSVVGDGDIGLSLTRGARAIEDASASLDGEHPAAASHTLASILRRVLGGTSGPLYAVFVLRAATTLASASTPNAPASWASAFRAGCEGVQALGGGKAGDRTMLDALLPAADAIDAAVARGDPAVAIVQAATQAAEAGVEATKAMAPRLGRSAYLGERTRGHPDPGAYAVAIWLKAIEAVI